MGLDPYGPVLLTLDNVLLPPEKLNPTVSNLDGLDHETEVDLRILGCDLIQTSGILLRLPQTAMATGQVLFQRFYYSKSFVRQPMETTAMACVYLASKIEEAPRRIRDVINVFHHIRQYRSGKPIVPLILDPTYVRLKLDVTLAERRVLKELGFCCHVKHPHKLIVICLQQLEYVDDTKFVQMAWNYMNDALRSSVFVRYTPESIACACVFLSARKLNIPLPNSPAWYLLYDATENELTDIASEILDLYDRPKVNYDQLEKKVEALTKAYQESRQKLRKTTSETPTKNTGDCSSTQFQDISNTATPVSSPVPGTNATKENVQDLEELPSQQAGATKLSNSEKEVAQRSEESPKPSTATSQTKTKGESNTQESRSRRRPSPIVYENSPDRNKHKKRKKSRYSDSRSRSRSRERKPKKPHRRDRERSPSPIEYSPKRHHHKKKARQVHRGRHSTSRSRSRERERQPQSSKKYRN